MRPINKLRVNIFVILLLLVFSVTACTQKKSFLELNSQSALLYKQGKFSQAAKVAKKAIKYGEIEFGKNHPNMATLIQNLARIHYTQGNYEKAQINYKKALILTINVLGQNHSDVGILAGIMSKFYREIGKEAEADTLQYQSTRIRLINQKP